MFEQSIVAAQPQNKTWTLGVSMLAQIGLVGAAVLFPLIYTEVLPAFSLFGQSIVAPLPPPSTPAPMQAHRATQSTMTVARPFQEPPTRFTKIDPRPDEPLAASYEPVIWSTGDTVGANPIDRILGNATAPPRPDTTVRETVKPEAKPRGPIRVSGPVQEAKLIRKIIPIYPPLAIQTRTQGSVHLVGVISKDGSIRNLQVVDGHPLLIPAAVDAVKQWVYRPTLLGDESVEVVAPITVTFILNR